LGRPQSLRFVSALEGDFRDGFIRSHDLVGRTRHFPGTFGERRGGFQIRLKAGPRDFHCASQVGLERAFAAAAGLWWIETRARTRSKLSKGAAQLRRDLRFLSWRWIRLADSIRLEAIQVASDHIGHRLARLLTRVQCVEQRME
jgi:hypothetical protein